MTLKNPLRASFLVGFAIRRVCRECGLAGSGASSPPGSTYSDTEGCSPLLCFVLQPAVSVGNVGQLAVDLLLQGLPLRRVGFLEHPHVLPCAGNDALDAPEGAPEGGHGRPAEGEAGGCLHTALEGQSCFQFHSSYLDSIVPYILHMTLKVVLLQF